MDRVGFIGLGTMGGPMAANVRRRQFPMVVHDLRAEATARLVELGAEAADGIAAVARAADVVITMLPGPKEVAGAVAAILAEARPGMLVMDMSTVDPETTDAAAAACRAQGVAFVDAPVGRLSQHAERGESLFMVGAEEADFARVAPLLEAMGTTIHHCGGPGAGTRTKLVNNLMTVCLCALNAEALTLASAFGLDLAKTLAVLNGTTAVNGQLSVNYPNKALAGDLSPGFMIDLAHKDLSLILAAGNAAKVPLAATAAIRELYSIARGAGRGRQDMTAVLDTLSDLAGVRAPRQAPSP
jgi:4-hydroxybutyrate dehydrogenase/sulfolactaldehyde 3-reductase